MSEEPDFTDDLHRLVFDAADIRIRDEAKRELDVRLVPWDTPIETVGGIEEFARGAFDDIEPSSVMLMEPEHEARIGLGQDGKPIMMRRAAGRGIALDSRDDAQYATFKVAATQAGDDILALAADGVTRGVSVEFHEVPGGTTILSRAGRRVKRYTRALLSGASTTYRPAYAGAEVIAVRSEGEQEMAEDTAPVAEAAPDYGDRIEAAITAGFAGLQTRASDSEAWTKLLERIEASEERARAAFAIPNGNDRAADDFHRGDWMSLVLRMMTGDIVSQSEVQARTAADLITADNLGVIPTAYLDTIIGLIDDSRPFLDSTTRLPLPRAGTTLSVPKIVTRPTTAIQNAEKDELSSGATSITPATFNMTTIGGYGDISIQLLKRSDPSYLQLYIDLLAEAYAIDADDKAVDVLLAASGVQSGGALDPEDLNLGDAWANAAGISRRLKLDRIWLSTAAVSAFIDAKSPINNGPLYSNLAGNLSAGTGAAGTISGLVPVHVPALDDEAVDVIVGPSRGFGWTEDGTYTLQVDVPAKAGRDVALVGMAWFAPLYPAAFTTFTIAS